MPPADAPAPDKAAAAGTAGGGAPGADAGAAAPAANAGGDHVAAAAPPAAAEGAPPDGAAAAGDHAKPADGAKPAADAKAEGEGGVAKAAETPSLLETIGKDAKPADGAKPDAKAAEPPKPEAGAKPDAGAEAKVPPEGGAKAEPLKYADFQFDGGVKLEGERFAEATGILGQHQVPQEAAQSLLNLHVSEMQAYARHLADEQQRVFGETRKAWRAEIMADEILGGAGHQTAMGAVARMRDMFVPENEREAFNTFLRVTGAGDNPHFVRLLHRIAQKFDEPPAAPQPHNPPPDRGRARGNRRAVMYDHPTSRRGNGAAS